MQPVLAPLRRESTNPSFPCLSSVALVVLDETGIQESHRQRGRPRKDGLQRTVFRNEHLVLILHFSPYVHFKRLSSLLGHHSSREARGGRRSRYAAYERGDALARQCVREGII